MWLLIKQPACCLKCLKLRNYLSMQEQKLSWPPLLCVATPYSGSVSLRRGHQSPIEASLKLKQIEGQNPVSRNKLGKQILQLLHVSTYAVFLTLVISAVMPRLHIA